MPSPRTFLSRLNEDELFTIAHATAKALRCNPWYQDIPEAVFDLLSNSDGPFTRISNKLFRIVGVNDIRGFGGDVLMSGRAASSVRLLNQLLERDIVKHLHLCDSPTINCYIHEQLYEPLILHASCHNLKTLVLEIHSVDVPLTQILSAHASHLEHLKVELQGLATGSLAIPPTTRLPRMKSLELMRFVGMHTILDVLESCSGTLRSLSLKDVPVSLSTMANAESTNWELVLLYLSNHCRNLKELSLAGPDVPVEQYVNLLISYGPRLARSNTLLLSRHLTQYERLLHHCPNLFSEMMDPSEFNFTLNHVMPRTNKLYFNLSRSNLMRWRHLMDRCEILTDLQIVSDLPDTSILPMLFHNSKMRLRKVSFFMQDLKLASSTLQTFMDHASELRDLELWVRKFQDHENIAHVLSTSKNLTRVLLWQNELITQNDALDFARNVLRAFRSRVGLEVLSITVEMEQTKPRKFKEAIRAECQFYRFRKAKIVVCGSVYFDDEGHCRI